MVEGKAIVRPYPGSYSSTFSNSRKVLRKVWNLNTAPSVIKGPFRKTQNVGSNPRHVFDASNYITYKKLSALQRNYNDNSA